MPFYDRVTRGSIFREPRNIPARMNPQSHDPDMVERILGAEGLFGQNIAKLRPGRTPEEATQRMRQLRAASPLTGQRFGRFKRIQRFRGQRLRKIRRFR